jgi:CubicO group peptidase (beta-lactamase class C family)
MQALRGSALVLTLAFVAAAGPASAQGGGSPARWIDSVFADYDERSPGCAVGVVRDGGLAFARGYGMASLDAARPITPTTPFYIASLSKQFTAMAILLLERDGRLSLDDPVRRWVPELPLFGARVTLRHLLHHTSGIRDYFTLLGIAGWQRENTFTETELLELVARQRGLNFEPGEQFLYSNTGYALLGIVVRRASGQSLRDFARARIFEPLGMRHTQFRDDHRQVIPGAAVGYQGDADFPRSEPNLDVVGDGGVFSTIEDLARWDANFRTHRVGGQAIIAALQTSGTLNSGVRTQYGLGLALQNILGERAVSHSGAYAGFRSTMLRFPERDLSIITLCNISTAPALADRVAALHLGPGSTGPPSAFIADLMARAPAPHAATPQGLAPLDPTPLPDALVWLEGRYYSDELNMHVVLQSTDPVLVLRRPRGDDMRFHVRGTDEYTTRDGIVLRVLRAEGGHVKGFALSYGRVRDLVFIRQL